jgi:hypothetical protein
MFTTAIVLVSSAAGLVIGIWFAKASLIRIKSDYWQHLPRFLRLGWRTGSFDVQKARFHRRPDVESVVFGLTLLLVVESSAAATSDTRVLFIVQFISVLPFLALASGFALGIRWWLFNKWLPRVEAQYTVSNQAYEPERFADN